MRQRTGDRPGDVFEPRVIDGHPRLEVEVEEGPPEPHWRPWGLTWKRRPAHTSFIYVCANCERVRTVMFLSKDRWLCTACRNEGTERPTFVPVARP